MTILITHNILWSKYKGGVFSALYQLGLKTESNIEFLQIAETEADRVGLADVDLSYHQYPYKLLFKGSYSEVPKWLLVKTLFLEIWQTKADMVVLAGFHLPEYWSMLLAARLRGKIIGVFCDSTTYDRPRSFFKDLLKRFFFSQCNAVFCYGQRSKEYLNSLGVPDKAIYFRRQAAALPHDYILENVIIARAKLQWGDAPRYLFAGRLSAEKNINDLLTAFKQVVATYTNAKLVIVGDGPLKQQLIDLTNQLDLADSIEFTGSKNIVDLQLEYLKASCMVLPSSSEPWGLIVNEALSFGCPVVVSHRCGCVPELVIEGKTGFVYECGNVDELAAKMIDAKNTFSDLEKTARECTDLISKFSPSAAAQQILDGCLIALAKTK
ncbi:MAG: glycosyltransferase family 4 protein [Methylococcales bacterium]|nr:glycosyltransferase family 4 protein [Methylococcales bacterium]